MKDTFCSLPFKHLYTHTNGTLKACCISGYFKNPISLKTQTIEEAYNSKEFRKLRLDLTNGVQNELCKICWDTERVGIESLRQNWRKELSSKHDMDTDGYITPNFEYIDVRFSNLCNFKCIMCGHEYSSMHYTDKHKELGIGKVINIKDGFVDELIPYIKNIKHIYFAGGEPLITKEHFELLSFLHKHNRNISIIYNTNLSVIKYDVNDLFLLWKDFKEVLVQVSLDGLYEKGEAIRIGLNTDKLINNIKTLHDNNIKTHISYTVGTYNVKDIYEFIEQLFELNLINNENELHINNFVTHPKKYSIKNLSVAEKKEIIVYLESGINTLRTRRLKDSIKNIISFIDFKIM